MLNSSFDRTSALKEVQEGLACPIEWGPVFRVEGKIDFIPLERLWTSVVESFAVDGEADFLGGSFLLDELSDEDLQSIQINVRTWRDYARSQYRTMTRRFWDLRYAEREEYSKHLPPLGKEGDSKSIQLTSKKDGISKFYRNIPPEDMLSAFFLGIFFHFDQNGIGEDPDAPIRDEGLWFKVLESEKCRIAFKTVGPIGASNGQETAFICFELNGSTPIMHAYPISSEEAEKINLGYSIIFTDALRGWGPLG